VNLDPKNIPRRSHVLITTQRTRRPSLLTAQLCRRRFQMPASSAPPTPRASPLGRGSRPIRSFLPARIFGSPRRLSLSSSSRRGRKTRGQGTTRWDPASRAPRILPRSLSLRRGEPLLPVSVWDGGELLALLPVALIPDPLFVWLLREKALWHVGRSGWVLVWLLAFRGANRRLGVARGLWEHLVASRGAPFQGGSSWISWLLQQDPVERSGGAEECRDQVGSSVPKSVHLLRF
jgi:hypothetical protein